jgi:hypothetical protein
MSTHQTPPPHNLGPVASDPQVLSGLTQKYGPTAGATLFNKWAKMPPGRASITINGQRVPLLPPT